VRGLFERRRRDDEGDGAEVALVTTDDVPGFRTVELAGFVVGAASSRGRALDRLEDAALALGAAAVVAVRIDSSSRGGAFVGDDQCFAYGTAVRLEPADS